MRGYRIILVNEPHKPPRYSSSSFSYFLCLLWFHDNLYVRQEVDGLNLTLDETLGDSNLHYSRVLKEKMAVREAAHKAMKARKAALVEASWCRILRAARYFLYFFSLSCG